MKLVKLKGDFVWHQHDQEDELFYVVRGRLTMAFRDKTEIPGPGDMIIVPRGIEHKPMAEEEVHLILFEPATTLNTGNLQNELTKNDLTKI